MSLSAAIDMVHRMAIRITQITFDATGLLDQWLVSELGLRSRIEAERRRVRALSSQEFRGDSEKVQLLRDTLGQFRERLDTLDAKLNALCINTSDSSRLPVDSNAQE